MSFADLRARQRETSSLCLRSPRLLRTIIGRSQGTFFGPLITPQALGPVEGSFASAEREHADGDRFFKHFPFTDPGAVLSRKRVLDIGCGYGGRTVWYAENCALDSIAGVEISERVAQLCRDFALMRGHGEIDFRHAFGEDLPFADDSFDAIVSYDVQEHVEDPAKTLQEIARVLAPGGDVWMVFPTYLGARSSHLDYVTQVPFLHRVFDPDAILSVVNEFLEREPERFGVARQPPSSLTPTGRRTLPCLNGADRSQSREYIARAGLEISWCSVDPIITRRAPVPLAGIAEDAMRRLAHHDLLPDLLIAHLAFHLRKEGAGRTAQTPAGRG